MSNHLLEVENLQTQFKLEGAIVRAVKCVSFSIDEGKVLGIVGESGCGKSVTALSIMRLIEPAGEVTNGKVVFHDEDEETRREYGCTMTDSVPVISPRISVALIQERGRFYVEPGRSVPW